MKNYKVEKRYWVGITQEFINSIEPVCGVSYIGKTKYQQASLRGVPRKRLSLLIPGCGIDPNRPILLEVGKKIGKYDGAERLQISIRQLSEDTANSIPNVVDLSHSVLHVHYHRGLCDVRICDEDDYAIVGRCLYEGAVLRTKIKTEEGARNVIAWHWTRYYTHLNFDDVKDLLDTFAFVKGETLSEANRRASRDLYRRSRELGWRKLSTRERNRMGLDGSCWQLISTIDEKVYRQTGCGDYTHREAHPRGH